MSPRPNGSCSISLSRQGFDDLARAADLHGVSKPRLVEVMTESATGTAPAQVRRYTAPEYPSPPTLTTCEARVLRALDSWSTVDVLTRVVHGFSRAAIVEAAEELSDRGLVERHVGPFTMYRRTRSPLPRARAWLASLGLIGEVSHG